MIVIEIKSAVANLAESTEFWKKQPQHILTNEEILSLISVDKLFLGFDGEILATRKVRYGTETDTDHKEDDESYELWEVMSQCSSEEEESSANEMIPEFEKYHKINEIPMLEVQKNLTEVSQNNATISDPIWVEDPVVKLETNDEGEKETKPDEVQRNLTVVSQNNTISDPIWVENPVVKLETTDEGEKETKPDEVQRNLTVVSLNNTTILDTIWVEDPVVILETNDDGEKETKPDEVQRNLTVVNQNNTTILDTIWMEDPVVTLETNDGGEKETKHDDSDYSLSDVESEFFLPPPSFEHLYKKLDNGQFGCVKCEKTSNNYRCIITHSQLHLERCCLCVTCGKLYKNSVALKQHEEIHAEKGSKLPDISNITNGIQENETPNYVQQCKKLGTKNKTCDYCGKGNFLSNVHFYDHLNVHTKATPYHCLCGSKVRSLTSYLAHIRQYGCPRKGATLPKYQDIRKYRRKTSTASRPKNKPQTKERITKYPNGFVCEKCDVRYKSLTSLLKHIDLKHRERTMLCPESDCKLLFPTKLLLQIHLRSHYELSKCSDCNKIIPTRKLKAHIRGVHSNEKLPCDECDFVGKNKQSLYLHKRIKHLKMNQPSVICVLCNHTFIARSSHFRSKYHRKAEQAWLDKYKISEFPCGRCKNLSFPTIHEVLKHLNINHALGNLACMEYLRTLMDNEGKGAVE